MGFLLSPSGDREGEERPQGLSGGVCWRSQSRQRRAYHQSGTLCISSMQRIGYHQHEVLYNFSDVTLTVKSTVIRPLRPPRGMARGKKRPQGLSGGVGGVLGSGSARGKRTHKVRAGLEPDDKAQSKSFSPRICDKVAKFAPVRALRARRVEGVQDRREEKGKTKAPRRCLEAFVLAPPVGLEPTTP